MSTLFNGTALLLKPVTIIMEFFIIYIFLPQTQPLNENALLASLLDFSKLPEQPPINGKIVRQGRSINWSQYLFLALKAKGQLASNSLLPWVSVVSNSTGHQIQNDSSDAANQWIAKAALQVLQ